MSFCQPTSTSSIMSSTKPYRISTITATGSLGASIDLDKLFANLEIKDLPNIRFIEYGKKRLDSEKHKYFLANKKVSSQVKVEKTGKRFDNQVTVLHEDESRDIYISTKIFKNGNIQMAGIRDNDIGLENMTKIRDVIHSAWEKDKKVLIENNTDFDQVVINNYDVRLINSDFKIGFPIRRDVLYKIMLKDFENSCSYEPCIYPGVKIQYFFNQEANTKNGVCRCSVPCITGKRNGCGDRSCKKITIAVFQSGSVIITGAHTTNQIDEVYVYIVDILKKYEDKIKKVVLVEPTPTTSIPSEPRKSKVAQSGN